VADQIFVNREEELERFRAVTQPHAKPVLVVWGEGGVGKSALRRQMEAACTIRKVLIEWRKTRPYDFVDIMRSVASGSETPHFEEFQQLLARFEEADRSITINLQSTGTIEVAREAVLQNVGSVTATAVNIERFVTGPRQNGLAANRMTRLTDTFLRCLGAATAGAHIMIFLDAFEMADKETKDWVWSEFATALDDESLRRVRLTVFTRETPSLEPNLRPLVDILPLAPLRPLHVVEYMRQRGVTLPGDAFFNVVADGIIAATSGSMISIVTAVEAMLAGQNRVLGSL
jgi:hypothetical protein